MSGEYLKSQTGPKDSGGEAGTPGFMAGKVIRNCDRTRIGRVKVKLTARGGMEIWARVVLPDTGVYFIPQVGEEVLVGFHQEDGNEAYVMGRLWNDSNPPPKQGDDDPVTKRVIHTPAGHDIIFDDKELSVTISTKAGQHIKLSKDGIKISADDKETTAITLDTSGNISVKAAKKISFSAPEIELKASGTLTLDGTGQVKINCPPTP